MSNNLKIGLGIGLIIFIITTIIFIIFWRKEVKKKQEPGPPVVKEIEVPVYKNFKNSENNILGFDYSEDFYLNRLNAIEDVSLNEFKYYMCDVISKDKLYIRKYLKLPEEDLPCGFVKYYIRILEKLETFKDRYDERKLSMILKNFEENLDLDPDSLELVEFKKVTPEEPLNLIPDDIQEKIVLVLKTEVIKMLKKLTETYCEDKIITSEEIYKVIENVSESFCNLSETE